MPRWKPGAAVAAYVLACILSSAVAPEVAPWLLESILAAGFVWTYLAFAGGRELGAIAWVAAITIVVPLVVLVVIGTTAYQSWGQLLEALQHGASISAFAAPSIVALAI